jgi:hypothetical protein
VEIQWVDGFVAMIDWEVPALLRRLALVSGTIASLSELHAEAKTTELSDKAQGWSMSTEGSVRGREKASTFNAVTATVTRMEIEAQLDSLREERDFIVFLANLRQASLTHA